MHATTEQLLSRRDGEPVDADVALHIEACATCTLEIERMQRIQRNLRSLAPLEAPAAAWQNIQARLGHSSPAQTRESSHRRHGNQHWGTRFMLGATAAAVVVFAIVLATQIESGGGQQNEQALVNTPTPVVTTAPSLEQLVAQSRELDDLLQNLPERPRVERVAMAATMDTIEQRIQWLDFQLSFEPGADLSREQAQRLWRERVDLMDSLVKVRYAQAHQMAF